MNDYKDLVSALRSKESRDNRELLDAAADVIEKQKAAIAWLEAENDNALRCVEYSSRALNASLIAAAVAHGERVQDEDKPDVFLGYRLTLPENIFELEKKYEMHARKDEKTNEIVVAVGLRDDPNDHKRDSE